MASSIFLLKISYALSLSISSEYFFTNLDLALISSISLLSKTSILLIGARIIVAANGVGIPFSFNAVTNASPIPSEVNISSV